MWINFLSHLIFRQKLLYSYKHAHRDTHTQIHTPTHPDPPTHKHTDIDTHTLTKTRQCYFPFFFSCASFFKEVKIKPFRIRTIEKHGIVIVVSNFSNETKAMT